MESFNTFDLVTNLFSGAMGVVSLLVVIASIVGTWKVFEKAGYAGWKSIIPIYNFYVMTQIVNVEFWKVILAIVLSIIPVINIVGGIYSLYLEFVINIRLAKGFGHDTLYGVLLVFFNPIMMILLGFNDDKFDKTLMDKK